MDEPVVDTVKVVVSEKGHIGIKGLYSSLRHFLFPLILPALDAAYKVFEIAVQNKTDVSWDSVQYAFYAAMIAGFGRTIQRQASVLRVDVPAEDIPK